MASFYNRRDEGNVAIFSIQPAPYPGGFAIAMQLVGGILITIIGFAMTALIIGYLFLPIGLLVIGVGLAHLGKRSNENARRVPSEIHVSPAGIAALGQLHRAGDIAELTITHQNAGPEKVRYERVTSNSQAIGATIRANTENAQAYVGYQVGVRLRSDSRPCLLVGGLTHATASSLVRDLGEALTQARGAAA